MNVNDLKILRQQNLNQYDNFEHFQVGKKADCDCAIVLSSNDFTRRIFVKLGMDTLKKTSWQDCTVDGKRVFGDVESEYVSSHFLRL